MKKSTNLKFSKKLLRGIGLIARYKGVKTSDLTKLVNNKITAFIDMEKSHAMKQLEGQWIIDKITDSQFKKITRMDIPIYLRREKSLYKHNTQQYKENARKALLMNIKI